MGVRKQLIKTYMSTVQKIKGEYSNVDANSTLDLGQSNFKQLVFFFDNRPTKGKIAWTD